MNLISNIDRYLKDNLSESRYQHTLRVATEAKRLATLYRVDQDKVYLAALLHDISKEKNVAWQKQMLAASDVQDQELLKTIPIMHAYTGSVLSKDLFAIEDEQILNAIKFHTIGNVEMDDIAKVVYIADYIEPERKQENVEQIRAMVACESLNAIILAIIENELKYFNSINKELHPDTKLLYNKLKEEC